MCAKNGGSKQNLESVFPFKNYACKNKEIEAEASHWMFKLWIELLIMDLKQSQIKFWNKFENWNSFRAEAKEL